MSPIRVAVLPGWIEAAQPYLWPVQRERLTTVASMLGELSPAIGAARLARNRGGS
jgi:hypothetical protein